MRILILGGTIFLGRHVTESALARGHEVVHLNRGQHGPDLYPELERIRGDRDGGLKALCEQAAEREMPGRTLSIRPGLIVGPLDPTDRFTYWPVRVARGADVLDRVIRRRVSPSPKSKPFSGEKHPE